MRCAIAKSNPALMDLASAHYQCNAGYKTIPVFTFKSLYSDEEPYPLEELIFCLGERIASYEAEFKQYSTETGEIYLRQLRRKRLVLMKILQKVSKEAEQ